MKSCLKWYWLICVCYLLGCSLAGRAQTLDSTVTTQVFAVVSGNNDPLAGIVFSDVNAELTDLGDLKGKVVFINFWASWCLPCLAEFPALKKLYQHYQNDPEVVFLFVDVDGNLEKAARFMQKRKYGLPVYRSERAMPDQIFAGQLPTTVVLDKKGRISYHEMGPANYGSPRFIAFIGDLKAAK